MSYVEGGLVTTRTLRAMVAGLVMAASVGGAAFAQSQPDQQQQQPQASGSTAPQGQQTPPKKDPSERVICREDEATGTRLSTKRICHTKREWDQIARDSGDMVDSLSKSANPSGLPH